jgi:DNA-binding transcriptional MerR regulator
MRRMIMTNSQEDPIIEVELSLEDRFFDQPVITLKAEADAMPAVLVDEELISEISAIPDRFGFKIGDVADLLGIKQYILRYWEQEFEILKPKKASNNQRLYTKKDVENAFLIKKLLYRDRFSIEGARQALRDVKFALKKEKDYTLAIQKIDEKNSDNLHQIKSFLSDVRKIKQLFT